MPEKILYRTPWWYYVNSAILYVYLTVLVIGPKRFGINLPESFTECLKLIRPLLIITLVCKFEGDTLFVLKLRRRWLRKKKG